MAKHYKVYEAVERAEKEYGEMVWETSKKPKEGAVLPLCPQTGGPETNGYVDCYEGLKTNLLAYHRDESIKTILFLGTTHGEGATTTAINFATTLAQNSRLNILLIEANLRSPSLHEVFNVDPEHSLTSLLPDSNKPTPSLRKKAGPENLYVVTPGSKLSGPVSLFESQRFWEFLKKMRTEFDYVILDGPPLPRFSECKVICSKVDGVVMVIESGKTRRLVALRAKKDIVEAGGRVLGVVLNKRKYHIPKWIYRRL